MDRFARPSTRVFGATLGMKGRGQRNAGLHRASRRLSAPRYIQLVPAVPVLVIGDDPLARAGLAALLAGRDDVAVVADAATDDAAGTGAGASVVLWDLGLGGAGGARAGPGAAVAAGIPVVALAHSDASAAEALRAGAHGVVLRGAPAEALAGALVAAARGLAVLDAALARAWLRAPDVAPDAEGLTAREREVLALLAEGLANKAIAARLGISEHTAKFHVNAILAKLGVESRAEAIVRAVRLGLVTL
jgi:DNA-binding NarL/FixJ family response regulator